MKIYWATAAITVAAAVTVIVTVDPAKGRDHSGKASSYLSCSAYNLGEMSDCKK